MQDHVNQSLNKALLPLSASLTNNHTTIASLCEGFSTLAPGDPVQGFVRWWRRSRHSVRL